MPQAEKTLQIDWINPSPASSLPYYPRNIILFEFIWQIQTDTSFHTLHRWLAVSADRRVSVWSASWAKDFCEMVDWLSYPAPAFTPDGTPIQKGDPVSDSYCCFNTEKLHYIVNSNEYMKSLKTYLFLM